MRRSLHSHGSWSSNCRSRWAEFLKETLAMPVTQAEHDRRLKVPAVCELLPLRDLPLGDNIMVRTNGAFVAGYELRGILAYFATDSDRNQNKSLLEALFSIESDGSMRVQFRYEISEHLGDLLSNYIHEQR